MESGAGIDWGCEVNYPNAIEAALNGIMNGANSDVPMASNGKGRPSSKRIVNGVVLDREDYDVYLALVTFWEQAKIIGSKQILSDEEFVVFMKEAAPRLNKRMIDMAMVSDDLKAVRQVASDLADRGYGKSAQQLNINVGIKDARSVWREIEDRGKIAALESDVIDAEEVD